MPKTPQFKLPSATERTVVFGRTGSGKTVFMTWLLSMASIEDRPWIILDLKQDEYLANLPRVEEIKLGTLPKHPGLYIVKANFQDDERVDKYLHEILAKGNTGFFTDEGSKIQQREPRFVGLKALFAQGRSKRTPVLFATQRPAWINQSVLSEGDHFASFHLHYEKDQEKVTEFMPKVAATRLDEFHCHWYDVKQDFYTPIRPVDPDQTLQRLDERLRPKRRFL